MWYGSFLIMEKKSSFNFFSTKEHQSKLKTNIIHAPRNIPGHLALALWASPSTALKSTAQARPRHGLIVLVPGTARPQCRAWASKSAHGPGPGTARFWARHDAGTTPGRRMQCDLLSTVGSRLGFHRVYILPSPDSASLTPTRTVRHRAASLSTRVRLALHSSGH